MDIELLEDETGHRRLKVEAPWAEVSADYDDLVARYARIRLAGFRAGRAPRPVVEQRFRKEIIEDLARATAQRLGRQAVRIAGLEAVGPLEATEIECARGKPFRAQVRFLPMPEMTLPDLSSLAIVDGDADARDRISHVLLELVRFDVSGELVRAELGLDGLEDAVPRSGEWIAAEERVRLMLILRRIARQEGIEVQEADVQDRIEEKARELGSTKAALRSELEEGGGLQRLRDMLLAESALDYLLERARGPRSTRE